MEWHRLSSDNLPGIPIGYSFGRRPSDSSVYFFAMLQPPIGYPAYYPDRIRRSISSGSDPSQMSRRTVLPPFFDTAKAHRIPQQLHHNPIPSACQDTIQKETVLPIPPGWQSG